MKRLLVGVVVGVGIIVFAALLLTLVPLRMHTFDPKTSALQSIRALAMAMDEGKSKAGDYPRSLAELATYLGPELQTGLKDGYRFAASGDGKSYSITATPVHYGGNTNHYGGNTKRSFYVDKSGDIRVSSGPEPANSGSPQLYPAMQPDSK
jgi:hypothetical protein